MKVIVRLLASLAFVAVGFVTISSGGKVITWLSVGFFALCAAVFALQLMPGASYLRITDEGFVFCSLFRKSPLILWREVSDFRVASVPRSHHKLIVFDSNNALQSRIRSVNRALVGASDGLPDAYGLKPQELADLLNSRRLRAISTD